MNAMEIAVHIGVPPEIALAVLEDMGGNKDVAARAFADTPLDIVEASARKVKPGGNPVPGLMIGLLRRWHITATEWNVNKAGSSTDRPKDVGNVVHHHHYQEADGKAGTGGKKKLHSITEHGAIEGEVLSKEDILKIRNVYFKAFKGQPPEVERPTDDQITALKLKLDNGEVPYVEFSVWGPYGRRIAKQSRYLEQVWTGHGYVQRQVPGPSDIDRWMKCWRVFKATMLMLEAASLTGSIPMRKVSED